MGRRTNEFETVVNTEKALLLTGKKTDYSHECKRCNKKQFLHKGIRATIEYLELFLKKLLSSEKNELKNRYLNIQWNVKKQNIHTIKQDIG